MKLIDTPKNRKTKLPVVEIVVRVQIDTDRCHKNRRDYLQRPGYLIEKTGDAVADHAAYLCDPRLGPVVNVHVVTVRRRRNKTFDRFMEAS